MDSSNFHLNLDYVSGSGIVLSAEQKAALQSSLILLKSSERFSSVCFWGVVKGVHHDYFVAQALGDDVMGAKKNFYTTDCVTWAQLPQAHALVIRAASTIRGRFTGNASHEYTVTETLAPADRDDVVPADLESSRKEETKEDGSRVITTSLSEDRRLSATVASINNDVAIAPRGAYRRGPTGAVVASRTFEGLSAADAGKLQNYLHVRAKGRVVSVLDKLKLDPAVDFLEPISTDVPTQSWSVQYERGGALVVLRSMLWPGFVFFHVPGTSTFGHVYAGVAQKNTDLAFMI